MGTIDDFTKNFIWSQFGASIDALEASIGLCPESLWSNRGHKPEFWYLAAHTLLWADCYLDGSEEGFVPPQPFGLNELEPAEYVPPRPVPYTKEETKVYLKYCRQKCHDTIFALTPESAGRVCDFPWGQMTFAELLLYSMRHVQHHTAQLNLILRQQIDDAPDWSFRAKEA